jgi:sulfur carrier protein ThiS
MEISIKLFSNFALYHSPSKFRLEMQNGGSVIDVLRSLKIPEDLPRIVLINGDVAEDQTILKEGDTLSLFSPVAGG